MHLHEAHPRVVIDGDMGELPAGAIHGVAAVARDAVARAHDATKLLRVNVQQFPRRFSFVAHRRDRRIKRSQAGQAQCRQETADGGDAAAHERGDAAHRHTRSAQQLDSLGQRAIDGAACSLRTGRAVAQGRLATLLKTQQPLASRLAAMRSTSNLRPAKVNLAFLWLFTWLISSESSEAW